MPDLNNWRNWWTNLLIRFGVSNNYSYGFSESLPDFEVEEEEVNLTPTVFQITWKQFFRNPTRIVTNTVKDVTGASHQENRARKAASAATKEAERAKAEYDRVTKETNEAVAKQREAYGAEKAEQERVVAETLAQQKVTAAKALATKKHATAAAGHSKVLEQRRILSSQIATQEALRRAKTPPEKTKVKGPGIAFTTVKSGSVAELALGGSGAVSKPPKVKPKLNI